MVCQHLHAKQRKNCLLTEITRRKELSKRWRVKDWRRGEGRDKQTKQLTCKSLFSWTNFSTNGSNFFKVAFSFSSRSFSGACDVSTFSARVLSLVAYFSKLRTKKMLYYEVKTSPKHTVAFLHRNACSCPWNDIWYELVIWYEKCFFLMCRNSYSTLSFRVLNKGLHAFR